MNPPKELEQLLSEMREEARWRMNIAKNARAYFGREYIERKKEYLRYDKLYQMMEDKVK